MTATVRLPYRARPTSAGMRMPWLPLTLRREDRSVSVEALVDSGSAINVLPYAVGEAVGARWDDQAIVVPLAGNLSHVGARALMLRTEFPDLPGVAVDLAFAWAQSDDVPVLLGQVNFFMVAEVCFFGSESMFEVRFHEQ